MGSNKNLKMKKKCEILHSIIVQWDREGVVAWMSGGVSDQAKVVAVTDHVRGEGSRCRPRLMVVVFGFLFYFGN